MIDGATHGFGADLWLIPAKGIGVAVCINSRPTPTDLVLQVLDLLR